MHEQYSVYKGLQRPIYFKGLKGNYIYYAFGLAASSLIFGVIISIATNFMTSAISMVAFLFLGILIMALYQRKYGLYRKDVKSGVYIVKGIFDK